jgi:putative membrane protein
MMYNGFGWWIFGGIFMIIFWGGLIALIVWAVTRLTRRGGPPERHDAMDIARERYARGEITREQFDQIKKDLG